METEFLTIGSFGASVLLTIILRMIYGTIDISNRLKPWIAVAIGVGLGIIAMFYVLPAGTACNFKLVVDYVIQGFMAGAAAVGFYEMTQKVQ
uniref:Putative holin n=1 Tax=viral metagenome TaxID=1070528 RepID=A0A6M3MCF2_9ZZZZ